MRKLGIYVQVPFCQTKCTYCNFHTGVVASSRFARYVEAVCREIREHRPLLKAAGVDWLGRLGRSGAAPLQRKSETLGEMGKRPASEGGPCTEGTLGGPTESKGEAPSEDLAVDTVYIGGGTPSLLGPAHLQKIFDAIREAFGDGAGNVRFGRRKRGGEPLHSKMPAGTAPTSSLQTGRILGGRYEWELGQRPASEGGPYGEGIEEVTLEADPETVEAGKAAAWVRAGINRVSFGLQSFSDKELVAAGRMHRRADIYRAVPILREAGIRNISFDLIAGLPHQTKESWRQSLDELAVL